MSDKKDSKSGFVEKATKTAAVVVGVAAGTVALAAVLPQHEIAQELPTIWRSIKGIFRLGFLKASDLAGEAWETIEGWWWRLKRFLITWSLITFILIGGGVGLAEIGVSFGRFLVAVGVVSLVLLGIALHGLGHGIATVLYWNYQVIGGVANKVTSIVGAKIPEIDQAQFEQYRAKVKIIFSATAVIGFSFLFLMFFPELSTLGWLSVFWAMAIVAYMLAQAAGIKSDRPMKIFLGIVIAMMAVFGVIFILDRLSGGALKFGAFREWLVSINRTEIIGLILLAPGCALLMMSFFQEEEKKSAYRQASVCALVIGAFAFGGLLYRGTVKVKQATGRETPVFLKEIDEKIQTFSISGKSVEAPSAPSVSSGGGHYLPPPNVGSRPSSSAPVSDPAPRPPKAKSPPPPIKAKTYDDAASAVDDLLSLQ